ncbi:TniB family NTP-binding protein [Paenibacillus aurantiacus]|uniref:TniB family NTP-binding protein n=1 Tax=Paenibacillus aurantiacus TaxID=1936118 RepID=A0ABV5KSF1_9BACL
MTFQNGNSLDPEGHHRRAKQENHIPILRVPVPPFRPTPKIMALKILEQYGVLQAPKAYPGELTDRISQLIDVNGTRMIVFDDVQHWIDIDTGRMMTNIAHWIRELADAAQIAVFFCGLPESVEGMDNFQFDRLSNEEIHHNTSIMNC